LEASHKSEPSSSLQLKKAKYSLSRRKNSPILEEDVLSPLEVAG
jgi:hypothetical protein